MASPQVVNYEVKPEDVDQAVHFAPTIHIDGAQTFAASNQIVKFNLFQDRLVGGGEKGASPVQRVICARLVMSPEAFRAIAVWMKQYEQVMFPEPEA